ncbi:hypothetical protein BP6252_03238 [Coleophoma cylindrospora]|uniref:Uncharacterized protein n=1 Tax=Coleophoma cylindrospora TaxID=1849047 RepID=A0A3D8S776_9HELO|nr:hypothetical protein BP6252_03238 [Coleophoma cylindrospora]
MNASHEKKTRGGIRVQGKSPIAAPPRVADPQRRANVREGSPTNSATSTNTTKASPGGGVAVGTPPHESEDAEDVDRSARDRKRIGELEKETLVLQEEFEKELTLLSHKLTHESETAAFWQKKYTALHQAFLKTDTDLKVLKQETEGTEGRDRDVKTRISSLILDRDAFREAFNEAMGEVRMREEEGRGLRDQVRSLKEFISSSSKGVEQVSDEGAGEVMQRLGNGLQNWVISNFRRVKIDIESLPDEIRDQISELVPTYIPIAAISKIYLIQSLISMVLVQKIFQSYFAGLPEEEAEKFKATEETLSRYGSAESLNQWRSTTLSILHKTAPQSLLAETDNTITSILHRINTLLEALTSVPTNPARDASLKTLISNAIDLARLLRVQKAVFSIIMPEILEHQRTVFDTSEMEDIGGGSEDDEDAEIGKREVRCVTFPGIIKHGDENGEQAHLRNVVSKARVLCAPD